MTEPMQSHLSVITDQLVMQPALGLGLMAARTPHPGLTRAINVAVHAVFGLGLYVGAVIFAAGVS